MNKLSKSIFKLLVEEIYEKPLNNFPIFVDDEFQEIYIKKLDDGTLEVTFRYQLSDWTFLYLLSFGEHVEIIEPIEARNILKEKAKKIFSLY